MFVFLKIKVLQSGLFVATLLSTFAGWSDVQRIKYKNVSYDVYRVNPKTDDIRFYWKNKQGERYFSFSNLKKSLLARGRKLIFATNAGIFEWGYSPLGLYVERGKKIEKLNRLSGRGNFYVKPNGVFFITKKGAGILSTRHYAKAGIKPRYATQSGPLLVRHNIIHRRFRRKSSSAKIRNGVGIDRKGRMVFAISSSRVNMYHFAEFFKKRMQCANALYLDGNISRMYLPAIKRNDLGGTFAVIIAASKKIKKHKKGLR